MNIPADEQHATQNTPVIENKETNRSNNLIPGYAARQRGEAKIQAVLRHTYQFHIMSPDIGQSLLGGNRSHAGNFLHKLGDAGLLQQVLTKTNKWAPRGFIWILTDLGVEEVIQRFDAEPYSYNTKQNSVNLNLVSHDATAAKLAGHFVNLGAQVIDSDYATRRKDLEERDSKISDFVLLMSNCRVGFEIELTYKKDREADQARLRAINSQNKYSIWVTATKGLAEAWNKRFEEPHVQLWSKNAGRHYFADDTMLTHLEARLRLQAHHIEVVQGLNVNEFLALTKKTAVERLGSIFAGYKEILSWSNIQSYGSKIGFEITMSADGQRWEILHDGDCWSLFRQDIEGHYDSLDGTQPGLDALGSHPNSTTLCWAAECIKSIR